MLLVSIRITHEETYLKYYININRKNLKKKLEMSYFYK